MEPNRSVFAAARIRRMKMFSAFFPLPPSDIFLLFRNRIFSPPLFLSSLVFFFFTLARFSSRSTASRTRSPRHSTHAFVISGNRGVLVKSSVSILENVKKRWVESRGCGFPPHFHASTVKTPDSKLPPKKEWNYLYYSFTVLTRSPLCLSYSISSIVPWQSSARIIRRIGF